MDHALSAIAAAYRCHDDSTVVQLAELALAREPDDANVWQWLGLALRRAQAEDAARAALETACTLAPLMPEAQLALAECYYRGKKHELARQWLLQLSERDTIPFALLAPAAALLGTLQEPARALALCRRATELRPDRHEAYYGVAYYVRKLGGSAEEVLPWLQEAFRLDGASALYRAALVAVLLEAGEHDEAYDLLRDADPATVHCRGCLRRMMLVFRHRGDDGRWEACQQRIRTLTDDADHSTFC